MTLALCLGIGAFVLALPNDSSEPASAPTTTRPPNCHERENLPDGISCGDVVEGATFAILTDYSRAVDNLNLQNLYAGIWADYQASLVRSSSPSYGGPVGECGGSEGGRDAYIARESGGDPNVWNTTGSGAWGCWQIIPGTWNSSCSDIGVHGQATVEQQAACASRLPHSAWSSSGPTG